MTGWLRWHNEGAVVVTGGQWWSHCPAGGGLGTRIMNPTNDKWPSTQGWGIWQTQTHHLDTLNTHGQQQTLLGTHTHTQIPCEATEKCTHSVNIWNPCMWQFRHLQRIIRVLPSPSFSFNKLLFVEEPLKSLRSHFFALLHLMNIFSHLWLPLETAEKEPLVLLLWHYSGRSEVINTAIV